MSRSDRRLSVVVFVVMMIAATAASGSSGKALPQVPERGLEGTWRVRVTIVDCATGAPGPQFWSLLTFAYGGTMTETTSNQALPGERTSGHGVWYRDAPGTYIAATEAFILFGAGVRPWTQRIDQRITMSSQDHFTSAASVAFSQTPGNLPGTVPPTTPGCATAEGFRF